MDDTAAQVASEQEPVASMDVLRSIGFQPQGAVELGGLAFDFGNLTLCAIQCQNRSFIEAVVLSGFYVSPNGRRAFELQHEMRVEEPSRESVLAHLAWAVDQISRQAPFEPALPAPWLEQGRANRHLLPWVRQLMELEEERRLFDARPNCHVEREWMRVAIRTLLRFTQAALFVDSVVVQFDGSVLRFDAEGLACAMPASGSAWQTPVRVSAAALSALQQRLPPVVNVDVWQGCLIVGRVRLPLLRGRGEDGTPGA